MDAATRVVLRPIATPLPLGVVALPMSTVVFSAVQLGWVDVDQGRAAALTAVAVTMPLQLLASVMGFLARDAVAATGMGVLAGTWGVVGLVTWTSAPSATSAGLGVLLLASAAAMLVPATAEACSKVVASVVMGLAAGRFAVNGMYELTGSIHWQNVAGLTSLALAGAALYAALALELEAATQRTVLPVGRRGRGQAAARGRSPLQPAELDVEAGVRSQL
jgi:uncharacterized protein